ncbi:MAG: CPBP family intramembrane metalloprotease [Akkermansiaceae bacterium]|jgi:membrane protease YdiL (CAAX protease family)|nr:CPBP family intramembrane metalloprotease [Akkermansiaceae bacterium]
MRIGIGGFRALARRAVPRWLLPLIFAGWVIEGWFLGDTYEDDKATQAEALERSADVAMTLDRLLAEQGALVNFLIGSGDSGETREWIDEEIRTYDLGEETEMDDLLRAREGESSEESLLAYLVAEDLEPDEEDWSDLEGYYQGTAWYGWQAEAFREVAGEESPAWVETGLAQRVKMEKWMVAGTTVAAGATLAFMLAGLVGVGEWWRSLRENPAPPRRLAVWAAGWIVLVYLLSDVAMNRTLSQVYVGLAMLEEWPLWVDIVVDALWRIGGVFLVLLLVLPRLSLAWRWFGMDRPTGWRATLAWLAVLLLVGSLWYPPASEWFPEPVSLSFEEDGWWGLVYSVVSGVILAPVCEEIIYRGVLFAGLWKKLGFWGAALVSSLVFTIVHHYGVAGTVGVFLLGVGCCVLYRRTGSLKGPIFLHAVYNGLITISSWTAYNAPFSLDL